MEDFLNYKDFKIDVLSCLKQSFFKYNFTINEELSNIEEPDTVIQNNKTIIQLSFTEYFPRIIVNFSIFDKEKRKINFSEIQKITGISENDIIGISSITRYKKNDTQIKKQLREINQLWLIYYEPLFND